MRRIDNTLQSNVKTLIQNRKKRRRLLHIISQHVDYHDAVFVTPRVWYYVPGAGAVTES